MELLKGKGFVEGNSGNAPKAKVATVAIWTTEPEDPDVQLVASYLGKGVDVARRQGPGLGVTIVVGDRFTTLAKGRLSVLAEDDAEICSPSVR
jgi:hypothetical protein